jgi:hypothetical protein
MDELKTIKSPPFSGKKGFKMWQIKFKAHLTYHKCIDIVTDDNYKATTNATALDPANSTHKPEIAKQDQNIRAFMLLTLAMSDAVSFEAVESSKTTNLPDGDAKLAWTTLTAYTNPITSLNYRL